MYFPLLLPHAKQSFSKFCLLSERSLTHIEFLFYKQILPSFKYNKNCGFQLQFLSEGCMCPIPIKYFQITVWGWTSQYFVYVFAVSYAIHYAVVPHWKTVHFSQWPISYWWRQMLKSPTINIEFLLSVLLGFAS